MDNIQLPEVHEVREEGYLETNVAVASKESNNEVNTATVKSEIKEELKCRCCKFVTSSVAKLEKHENGHRQRGTFHECEYCDFCTNTREIMVQHVTKHTGERPFKCQKCDFSSRWKRDLIKHQVKHSDEKRYMCSQCDFTTKWYNNIHHHMITHSNERPFTCHICDMKFKRKTGLDYHLYRHNDYKPKKCSKCDFRCKTNFELKYHQHKHSNVRNFPCTFPGCSQKCKTKSDLNKHLKIHTNIRDKICDICKKGFVTLANLSKHKLRHVTERNFKCDLCSSRFKTRTSLRHHLQTHSDKKPFSCDVCGHEFRNRHNLKTHKLTHSDDRPYKCPICPYAGKFPFHIFAHIGTFHGDKFAYFCEICRKPFSRYSQLQTHCARMHKDKDMLKATPTIKEEKITVSENDYDTIKSATKSTESKTDTDSKEMHTSFIEQEKTSESSKESPQDDDSPQPNVIIYNIGPFRLPLASKGFNFNFDKTGKKPKNWFMEPSNMTDEKAAEKQRAYMEKKARNVERSRGAKMRKFGWKKPPYKPRQTVNVKYLKEREMKKQERHVGRGIIKKDPGLNELINVGRKNIKKIKICKRAGQLMKHWKELEIKLEKLDEGSHHIKDVSVNLNLNPVNSSNDSIILSQTESMTTAKDTVSVIKVEEQSEITEAIDLLQGEGVYNQKQSLAKKAVGRSTKKKRVIQVNDIVENNDCTRNKINQKEKKVVIDKQKKRPSKKDKPRTKKPQFARDGSDKVVEPFDIALIETGDIIKSAQKTTEDKDTPILNNSKIMCVNNSTKISEKRNLSTFLPTGRLTKAINKLMEKKNQESKHLTLSDKMAVVLNNPASESDVCLKRNRKSESPRKVKKVPKPKMNKIVGEEGVIEIKHEVIKILDNDTSSETITRRPRKKSQVVKTVDSLPNKSYQKGLCLQSKDIETSSKKILENLLQQPFTLKRNLTDVDMFEVPANTKHGICKSKSSTNPGHSKKYEMTLSSFQYDYKLTKLSDLLNINYSFCPQLTLKTTDYVGHEPEKITGSLNINSVCNKEELVKIQKNLQNEKYRLKRKASQYDSGEWVQTVMKKSKFAEDKSKKAKKHNDDSRIEDCPILKKVLMKQQPTVNEVKRRLLSENVYDDLKPLEHKNSEKGENNVAMTTNPILDIIVSNSTVEDINTGTQDQSDQVTTAKADNIKRKYIKQSSFWQNRKQSKVDHKQLIKNTCKSKQKTTIKDVISVRGSAAPDKQHNLQTHKEDKNKKGFKNTKNDKRKLGRETEKRDRRMNTNLESKKIKGKTSRNVKRKKPGKATKHRSKRRNKLSNVEIYLDVEESEMLEKVAESLKAQSNAHKIPLSGLYRENKLLNSNLKQEPCLSLTYNNEELVYSNKNGLINSEEETLRVMIKNEPVFTKIEENVSETDLPVLIKTEESGENSCESEAVSDWLVHSRIKEEKLTKTNTTEFDM